ncbi:MAG: TonB-dependent receptor [Longimicrobiales bacterium]
MIASLVLAALTVLPAQQPGTVWGRVRSEGTGAPIQSVMVEVIGTGTRIVAETDNNGVYILREIPPGRRLIRATHIDHAAHEIEMIISAGVELQADFDLRLRPVLLPSITARVQPVGPAINRDTSNVQPTDVGPAAVRAMEATPGVAELGLAEAARDVPGNEPIDPSDVLFVRGGTADLKLVLLDGAPVFAPFHIGGLIHALDTDLLRSASIYNGGAPARYDGGLSYVMDMETRTGRTDRHHANVSADLLAARALLEGPVTSGVSYVIGTRGVHGLGAEPFVGEPFPYSYGDAVGRVDFDIGATRLLSATGFWNRETVRLDSLRSPNRIAAWGNRAGSLRFRGPMLGGDGVLTVAGGEFQTELPVGGLRPLLTEGQARRVRASAAFERSLGDARLEYGASFDRLEFDQFVYEQGAVGPDSIIYGNGNGGSVTGFYAEATVNPASRLRLRGGLRADVFSIQPDVVLAPRISATFLITDRVALTLAAGRYRQYVQDRAEPLAPIGAPLPDPRQEHELVVASASHLLLALDQQLGDGFRLTVEGFYKDFQGLPNTLDGRAESSGVDLWVRRNEGRFRGWFGYSLAWVWSDDDDAASPTHLFAGRQLLTAGVNGPVIGRGTFDVRVSYGSGLPFAAIPEPEAATPVFGIGFRPPASAVATTEPLPAIPNAPDQPYLRVDARLARTWSAEWRGISFELTPYVKVLNALNRRDGIFYYFDRGAGSQARALADLPVLPIIGLDWKF